MYLNQCCYCKIRRFSCKIQCNNRIIQFHHRGLFISHAVHSCVCIGSSLQNVKMPTVPSFQCAPPSLFREPTGLTDTWAASLVIIGIRRNKKCRHVDVISICTPHRPQFESSAKTRGFLAWHQLPCKLHHHRCTKVQFCFIPH
jgi:hypothetical protein